MSVHRGHHSEGLRRYGCAIPEWNCFTIAFEGGRRNLDLGARDEDVALRWVRGLRTLRGRLRGMSQRERLEQYPMGSAGSWEQPGGILETSRGISWTAWRRRGDVLGIA